MHLHSKCLEFGGARTTNFFYYYLINNLDILLGIYWETIHDLKEDLIIEAVINSVSNKQRKKKIISNYNS